MEAVIVSSIYNITKEDFERVAKIPDGYVYSCACKYTHDKSRGVKCELCGTSTGDEMLQEGMAIFRLFSIDKKSTTYPDSITKRDINVKSISDIIELANTFSTMSTSEPNPNIGKMTTMYYGEFNNEVLLIKFEYMDFSTTLYNDNAVKTLVDSERIFNVEAGTSSIPRFSHTSADMIMNGPFPSNGMYANRIFENHANSSFGLQFGNRGVGIMNTETPKLQPKMHGIPGNMTARVIILSIYRQNLEELLRNMISHLSITYDFEFAFSLKTIFPSNNILVEVEIFRNKTTHLNYNHDVLINMITNLISQYFQGSVILR